MNLSELFDKLKIGDILIIEKLPSLWSNAAGGKCGMNVIKYPYHFTIESIVLSRISIHIAIKDTNGYGWSINDENIKLFTHINRVNRIKI